MAPLKRVVPLLALLVAQPAFARIGSAQLGADPIARWQVYIAEASDRFGIPERWIDRVIRAESGGSTTLDGAPITSPVGAMGLMQLMPRTWAAMRAANGLGNDPYDPHDNIIAGTAYLRAMYDRFGYPGLFAAYNAGPARYAAYLSARRALPLETSRYLEAVTATPAAILELSRPMPAERLFVRREPSRDAPQPARHMPCNDAIFAVHEGEPCTS
ncbi:lytic transglycosylase domain-containing protein [Sphingomonas koreensis]|nr:lytic transglycosylase domain-containing protein [Sphingomonas koreensis]